MSKEIGNNVLRVSILTILVFVLGANASAGGPAGRVPPSIVTQPASQTVNFGQSATFSVVASANSSVSYQWRKNSAAIRGARSSSYQTPATTTSDTGAQYTVIVSNKAGSSTSSAAVLTVLNTAVAPSVTTQPASQTVNPGQPAIFSVATMGTAPMAYQWMKNQTAVGGAISSTYQTPATLTSDSGAQFTVMVTNVAGNVTSNAATLTVNPATYLLSASPTQLNFGNVNVSSNSTQTVTLTNTGNSSVHHLERQLFRRRLQCGRSGTRASLCAPQQNASVIVTFAPAVAGSTRGAVTITSNAAPITIALSGTGVAQVIPHSVSLNWTASTSSVIGYNVYSGTVSGGPYSKLTSAPTSATNFMDSTVRATQTYYYVTTSVDSSNTESVRSSEASAIIP